MRGMEKFCFFGRFLQNVVVICWDLWQLCQYFVCQCVYFGFGGVVFGQIGGCKVSFQCFGIGYVIGDLCGGYFGFKIVGFFCNFGGKVGIGVGVVQYDQCVVFFVLCQIQYVFGCLKIDLIVGDWYDDQIGYLQCRLQIVVDFGWCVDDDEIEVFFQFFGFVVCFSG